MIGFLPDEILQLRNVYASCIKLTNETDSKKEDFQLQAEAALALIQLQEKCSHMYIVCQRSSYEGSSCMDYDDRYPEERICLCCGIKEYSSNDKFKSLNNDPLARFEGVYPDQIKNPLLYLLSETIEIALAQGYKYFKKY